MRTRAILSLAVAACALAGCNQPAVAPKAPAFQSSENTVRDWNDVAHKIGDALASTGLVPAPLPPGSTNAPPPPRPVFIRVQAPDSAFVQEVASELENDILLRGGKISRTPTGSTVVNLDVNFVVWGPRDKPPGLLYTTAGILSIPGIVMGASAPMSTWTAADAAAFSAIGLGLFLDGVIALTPTMNAEAVWTASVVTDDQVVMKIQEPIYVRNGDIPLYAKAASLSPVSSWSTAPALRVRTIRYDP